MKDFVLIEPTNVKIIYARNFLLTLSTAFIKLAIKRNDDLVKVFLLKFDLESSTITTKVLVLCVYLSACSAYN